MNLHENTTEHEFRCEVREFVRKALPLDLRWKVMHFMRLEKQDIARWHDILYRKGWAAPAWPKAYGGPGWTPVQRKIFEDETMLAGAPRLMPHTNMIGPVLQHFGTEAQKARFLPRMLAMQDWWCQGYSEPGSGSDLASLQTRAIRDGDRYIVNGQKIWTSFAHWADWMFCLVRTSSEGKPQRGITFLLIDMKTPGITVRPIRLLNGDVDLNEVFFDNVIVPVENRIQEEDQGWTVAKHLLGHERTEVALVGLNKRFLMRIKQISSTVMRRGQPLLNDFRLRDRIARLEMRLIAHEWLLLRILSSDAADTAGGSSVSILKLQGSVLNQDLSALLLECAGPQAVPYLDAARERAVDAAPRPASLHGLASAYVDARRHTIYGGTTEVQKNIIGKSLVGL